MNAVETLLTAMESMKVDLLSQFEDIRKEQKRIEMLHGPTISVKELRQLDSGARYHKEKELELMAAIRNRFPDCPKANVWIWLNEGVQWATINQIPGKPIRAPVRDIEDLLLSGGSLNQLY